MIIRLRKTFRFEASHQLKHHDGKCARLHGHSWTGFIEVEGRSLQVKGPKTNMMLDYSDLGRLTKGVEERLDHEHLNDVFKTDMPTSEMVAMEILAMASSYLVTFAPDLRVSRVVVRETCTTECEVVP